MRNIKELLQVMLNHINMMNEWNDGMCVLSAGLRGDDAITEDEFKSLSKYIKSNPPENKYNYSYFFEPGLKQPRIEWLEQHIKLNS